VDLLSENNVPFECKWLMPCSVLILCLLLNGFFLVSLFRPSQMGSQLLWSSMQIGVKYVES